MTSQVTAYTPLESLLLFQALRADGVNSTSFNRISEQLKAIPLVRNDPTYDAGRLSPDALRVLYLVLLKEAVKEDLEHDLEQEDFVTNGVASAAGRKRKAASPTLPTVHEAAQHSHLIPQLVMRLYARYREKTVRELREYERRYETLRREVGEIEAGKWDDRLQQKRSVSRTRSPTARTSAVIESEGQHDQQLKANDDEVPITSQKLVESAAQPAANKPYSQAKIDAVINHGPEPQPSSAGHRRTSSTTTLPPISEIAPPSPHFALPQQMAGQIAQTPRLQQGNGPSFHPLPSNSQPSTYPSHHAHPTPSPHMQASFSRPLSSPRPILPPPPGMAMPPSSQHVGPLSMQHPQILSHPYYPSLGQASPGPTRQSPVPDHPPRVYTPSMAGHAQPYPTHYSSQQPYQDRRTSFPPPQTTNQTNYQPQPFQHAGYQLQPFSVNQLSQSSRHQQRATALQPSYQSPVNDKAVPPHLQHSASAPSTNAKPPLHPKPRLISDIVAALATPLKTPLWKSGSEPAPPAVGEEPEHPGFEPLSPSKERAKPLARSGRPTRRSAATESSKLEPLPLPATRRRLPARDRSSHSVIFSAAGELPGSRTRSQSVSTTAGGALRSDDHPASRDFVKNEPSTPAATIEQPDSAQQPSTTPASGPMTRNRRGTLQSQVQPPTKRKRHGTTPEEASADPGTPPPRPTTIMATRNFAKTSATIMNDINSHKHASFFAGPVRDRAATGYSEIIKQPQNLKSIRAAINAGTRAVAAATSSVIAEPTAAKSTAATGDGSTNVELQRSLELMPPKAIVNAVQLEKEVYRMLANAVMFNPGEDGLVQDARETFADVQAKIAEWRSAEREEDAGAGEGKGKRRKM